jgi:hypothetical protein
MFDIYGDEIVLDGHRIGKLEGGWPTLRERAVALLLYGDWDYVARADHEDIVEDLKEEIASLRDQIRELEDAAS